MLYKLGSEARLLLGELLQDRWSEGFPSLGQDSNGNHYLDLSGPGVTTGTEQVNRTTGNVVPTHTRHSCRAGQDWQRPTTHEHCTNIERDLRDALGHTDQPATPTGTNGYLW
jgi:hypothetical protein